MKRPLIVTARIELGAGLALLFCPTATVAFLLGSPLTTSAAVALGRLAGTALLALGIANWLARGDERSGAVKGLITAMTVYNLGAVIILDAAGIRLRPVGVALWPAVLLHAAMTVWCVRSLLREPIQIAGKKLI